MVVIFVDVVQCPLFLACRQFFPFATGPADVYLGMLGDVMKLFPEDAEVLSHPSHRRCLLLPRGCFRTGIASKEIIIGDTDVHHVGVGHPLHDAGVEHLVEEVARTVAGPPQYLHPAGQGKYGLATYTVEKVSPDVAGHRAVVDVCQHKDKGFEGIGGFLSGFHIHLFLKQGFGEEEIAFLQHLRCHGAHFFFHFCLFLIR